MFSLLVESYFQFCQKPQELETSSRESHSDCLNTKPNQPMFMTPINRTTGEFYSGRLTSVKRKLHCHNWHLLYVQVFYEIPESRHAVKQRYYPVETGRPHFQKTNKIKD